MDRELIDAGVQEALAWDLVAAAQHPPIHPTTAAVVRLLFVLRVAPFRVLAELMPCDKETVRQQLCRLMAIGVVEKVVVQQKGRHALCLYALAPDGIRMVLMWNRARAQLLGQVRAQLAKAGKAEYLDGGSEM